MESSDPSTWYPIYRDLARLIGVENTLIIFQNYHGL